MCVYYLLRLRYEGGTKVLHLNVACLYLMYRRWYIFCIVHNIYITVYKMFIMLLHVLYICTAHVHLPMCIYFLYLFVRFVIFLVFSNIFFFLVFSFEGKKINIKIYRFGCSKCGHTFLLHGGKYVCTGRKI